MSDREQISILSAKVTALTMLVEALWVGALVRDPDPKMIAKHIVDDIFKTDEKVREKVGESAYSLRVSETLTSLMDRALKRALSLQSKRPRR